MIVQNVGHGGATDLSFTVPRVELGKAKKTLDPIVRELGARELTTDASRGQGQHRRRGPAQRPGLRGADVRDAGRRRRQHRDDLDLRGPDHLHDRRGRARDGPARAARRRSSSSDPEPIEVAAAGWPSATAVDARLPRPPGALRRRRLDQRRRARLAGRRHAGGLPRRRRRADRGPRSRRAVVGRPRRVPRSSVARLPADVAAHRTMPGAWPPRRRWRWPMRPRRSPACRPGTVRLKWPNDLVDRDDRRSTTARRSARSPASSARRDGLGSDDPRVVIGLGIDTDWAAADFPADLAAR